MRLALFLLLAACAACLPGCGGEKPSARPGAATAPQPEMLLRLHFAGGASLGANPEAAHLNRIAALPASVKLREQVLEKLARELPLRVLLGTNAAKPEHADLLRPLLDDLQTVESQFTLRESPIPTPTWTLAVKLDDARAALWQTNLARLRAASVGSLGITKFSVSRAGGWLLVGNGAGSAPAPAASGAWLAGEANLPKLAPLLGLATDVPWPHVQFTMSNRADIVRTEARLRFAQPPRFAPGPWLVPTNLVRDPLVSFTATRGIADWLGRQPLVAQLGWQPVPDQGFVWSRSDIPYQTLVALPAPAPVKQATLFGERAPALLNSNLQQRAIGSLLYVTNRQELVWRGLPLLLPFVRPAPAPGGDFLLAGLMGGLIPQGPNTNPPPAALLAQFTRTNLVYYDWEITEVRLQQCRQISQLVAMLSMQLPTMTTPAAGIWLNDVAPKLGNTITEATTVSPTELRLVRNSHLGLTGVELVLLARWLDNPAFPALHQPAPPGAPPLPK